MVSVLSEMKLRFRDVFSRGRFWGRNSLQWVCLMEHVFLTQCPIPAGLTRLLFPMALYSQNKRSIFPSFHRSAEMVPDTSWSCSTQMYQLFVHMVCSCCLQPLCMVSQNELRPVSPFLFSHWKPDASQLILSWERMIFSPLSQYSADEYFFSL